MKNSHYNILLFCLFLFCACKSLRTDTKVKEHTLPATYGSLRTADSVSVGEINWRNYFSDTLLIGLIDSALVANPDLQIAMNRIETARAQAKAARNAQLPVINANINMSKRKFGYYTMDDAGNRVTEFAQGDTIPTHLPDYYAGLTTNWEIDAWGKLKNKRKSAVAAYLASIEGIRFVTSNLVAEIATAYYELLSHDNALEIIQQTITKQETALSMVKAQMEAGKANALAVQQFESRLLHSKTLAIEIEQDIVETENRINLLLGRLPAPINRKADKLFTPAHQLTSSGIPSDLLTNRPDIKEAGYWVEASRFDLNSAKAAFFPTLNITAAFGYQAYATRFLFQNPSSIAYNVVGGLITPVINRQAIKAHFHTAKANQLSAMYLYQKTILNAYIEVMNELSTIDRIQRVNSLKTEQKNVLNTSVSNAQDLYTTGRATYLEVLYAQQEFLNTQLDVIELNKQKQLANVRLYKALGGGWK